jgi:hypothetical protein
VQDFHCPSCGQHLTFENSRCLSCGNELGFDLEARKFVALSADVVDVTPVRCANFTLAGCNWLLPRDRQRGLCASCVLTRTRPADDDADALPAFAMAETAKRRLVLELSELGLPLEDRIENPYSGLCFDLLSSERQSVVTGHADGVVTLDLAEGNDVHREQLRLSMDEPYRTLLGHFRHEIGHYYFFVLVNDEATRSEFDALFGNPDIDYQKSVDRHYAEGPPPDWRDTYVSAYATMHPAEDWAETFAHYLHIRDTLDTAAAFGFAPARATITTPNAGAVGFDHIIDLWLPLAWALNMVNRSMGHPDLYPFVLTSRALDKMRMLHRLVTEGPANSVPLA